MNIPTGTTRRATLADLQDVLELDRRAPVEHARVESLTSRVQTGEVIVFEFDNRLLGYASVRARGFIGRDFVELMSVSTGERRQGIATDLLEEAVRQSSTERIFTSTNESNAPMRALLTKLDWRFSGQLDGIDDGDPEFIYYQDARSARLLGAQQ